MLLQGGEKYPFQGKEIYSFGRKPIEMGRKGFTLIEIVVVLAVVAILAAFIVPQAYQIFARSQEKETILKLEKLKKAIVGDPTIIMNEARTSFGYIGDTGVLPPSLEDLKKKGTQPVYFYNSTLRIGAGWNGPYIEIGTSETQSGLTLDQWGNALVYDTTQQSDPATGATIVGRIISSGPDKTVDTSDDIVMNIFLSESFSKTVGFIKDATGNPFPGVVVTMNYPQNGTLVNSSMTTDASGYYSFDRVPFGNRSVTLDPKLVYALGSAITSPTSTQDTVSFKVTNFSARDVTITSLKAIYSVTPPAYYESVKIGGKTVWSYSTTRAASGTTVTFAPQTVAAGSTISQSVVLRVQSPITEFPELLIGKIGQGASLSIDLINFRDVQTGSAKPVTMTGVSFEIDFSDGSIVIFTP